MGRDQHANTSVDIDHIIAYLSVEEGGAAGLDPDREPRPHIRYHHRIKTFGGWQVCQPEPGSWIWRSPRRRIYLVNATGTHPLGNTELAQTIWRAAADSPENSRADRPDALSRSPGGSQIR